ncbi:uncharacterized protein LOC135710039, partial [Ochlerotatus camptorhynchus]|uniref:uncharacterized protein LOC135710039 n=1 Tax=Ochlerotatus camptorhynchus TaxID=644619 RepID=UPI0031E2E74A
MAEWMRRLNQVTVCTSQQIIAASSTTTVPTTNSETVPQFPAAGSNQIVPPTTAFPSWQPTTFVPGYGPYTVNPPLVSGAVHSTQVNYGHPSSYAAGQTSGYMHDFQPGGGAVPLNSSTPTTKTTWINSVSDYTNTTQCLPPTISSAGQLGGYPSQGGSVSQPYQATSSQVPLPNQQVPVLNQQVPAMNCEANAPTSRQLAARHVMPRELPVFSGNPEEWPMFFSAFNTSTEACGYSDVENLGRLQRCLKGVALESVRSRLLLPASVPQVMQTLQLLYGHPEQIIYALLAKIHEVPAPKAENLHTLIAFGVAVQNFCDHLEAAGQVLHLSNPVLLQELVDKLPANLKLEWVTFKRQFLVADLRVFGRYMSNLVSAAAEVSLTLDCKGTKPKKEEKAKSLVNAHLASSSATDALKPSPESSNAVVPAACFICGNPDHRLFNKDQTIDTLAFIDEGSSVTLMKKSLADLLEVAGVKKRLCLTWTGNITSRLRELEQTLRYKELAERYEHLRKMPIKDFECEAPGILIGAKNTHLTATLQIREGQLDEPIAAKTRLGWAIYGAIPKGTIYPSYNLHICGCDTESELHELVKQYFTVENTGVSVDRCPESEDDKRARALLERTTKRIENDYVEFPESYAMAVRRLQYLERRLKASPEVFKNIQQQRVEYQEKGYIHEATEIKLRSADPRRMWYLPVGIVQNPKKPNKIRIVWDAAAVVDGVSLNSKLMKGPDLVEPLPDVLSGFRERSVAVVGDIKETFHQLKMRREDRYSQLFLWLGELGQPIKTFVIDVATFESTSSPCSAQFVKNLNAAEHAERYPRAAEAIQRRHYVDDYLQSFDSEEEACQVVEEVKLVHKQGGFIIRNWLSNSSAVLRRVGEVNLSPAKIVGATDSQIERVLGMQWKAEEDVFVFSSDVKVEAVSPTKRSILRC